MFLFFLYIQKRVYTVLDSLKLMKPYFTEVKCASAFMKGNKV